MFSSSRRQSSGVAERVTGRAQPPRMIERPPVCAGGRKTAGPARDHSPVVHRAAVLIAFWLISFRLISGSVLRGICLARDACRAGIETDPESPPTPAHRPCQPRRPRQPLRLRSTGAIPPTPPRPRPRTFLNLPGPSRASRQVPRLSRKQARHAPRVTRCEVGAGLHGGGGAYLGASLVGRPAGCPAEYLALHDAALAQLVEQRFCKPQVAGSSPAGGFPIQANALTTRGSCSTRDRRAP